MPKVESAYCKECKKKLKPKDMVEITTDPSCPDCGTVYLDQWESDEITCENEGCYTHERVLLVREDIYNAQQKAQKLSEKISGEKNADKRTSLMSKQRGLLNSIRDTLTPNKDESPEDFVKRMDSIKYRCSDCDNVQTMSTWKKKGYVCPKCKEPQMVKVTRDKTVFKPKEAKHITVTCKKYHTIARLGRG